MKVLAFSVTDFTLAAPGTCPITDGACGHVHLKIDGDACDNTPMMAPYNAAGAASPLTANFALCAKPKGAHSALLYLEHDNH